MDEGKREGSVENGKIDLIYEFCVTFDTDLHVSLTSAVVWTDWLSIYRTRLHILCVRDFVVIFL